MTHRQGWGKRERGHPEGWKDARSEGLQRIFSAFRGGVHIEDTAVVAVDPISRGSNVARQFMRHAGPCYSRFVRTLVGVVEVKHLAIVTPETHLRSGLFHLILRTNSGGRNEGDGGSFIN